MTELRFEPSGLLLVNKSMALSDVMEYLGSLETLLESGLLHLYFEQETDGKCYIKLLGIGAEGFKNVDLGPENCYKLPLHDGKKNLVWRWMSERRGIVNNFRRTPDSKQKRLPQL